MAFGFLANWVIHPELRIKKPRGLEFARGQVLIQVRLLKNRRTPRLAIASERIGRTIPQHMIVKMSSVHASAFLSEKILSD